MGYYYVCSIAWFELQQCVDSLEDNKLTSMRWFCPFRGSLEFISLVMLVNSQLSYLPLVEIYNLSILLVFFQFPIQFSIQLVVFR